MCAGELMSSEPTRRSGYPTDHSVESHLHISRKKKAGESQGLSGFTTTEFRRNSVT